MLSQTATFSTLSEVLRHWALHRPEQVAYRWLQEGERETDRLTYRELDLWAIAIATSLQPLVQSSPTAPRILLVYSYDSGLDFIAAFLGCLVAGAIAVPCHPPRNQHALVDVQARLMDCEAVAVLTEAALLPKLKQPLLQLRNDLHFIATAELRGTRGDESAIRALQGRVNTLVDSEAIAFLQYTSGTTGKPKGVIVTHQAILQNERMLQQSFANDQHTIVAGWLPLFHDMGLIGNVLQPLYLGASSVLMSPLAFVQKPMRWLQAISTYQVTVSGGPNFAYDLLCRRVTTEQKAELDLSTWTLAFSGAETVRAETLARFVEAFSGCGFRAEAFYPCYGMAEATLFITGGRKTEPPIVRYVQEKALQNNQIVFSDGTQAGDRALVGCGRSWLDTTLQIVDPQTCQPLLDQQVGEVWVRGSSLAQGYWNQPEATQQTFGALLKSPSAKDANLRFLRTGDLGFLHEGELFITGRLKEILILWGFNHYPQHIERTAQEAHPALRENGGAAFVVDVAGENRLVLAQEVERSARNSFVLADVVETVRWAVFDQHFVEVWAIALLKPGSLPRTSSGKIQRRTCRDRFLSGELETLAQWQQSGDPTAPQASEDSDITATLNRYLDLRTHLRRWSLSVWGKLRRWFNFDRS